jgi:hypothetical protein
MPAFTASEAGTVEGWSLASTPAARVAGPGLERDRSAAGTGVAPGPDRPPCYTRGPVGM